MKRDIFRRPTRMVHPFGEIERINDPRGENSFEFKAPMPGRNRRTGPLTIQQHGDHDVFSPSRSPICKPGGGTASLAGPKPDWAEAIAAPIPPSTKRRVGFLKTSK